MGTLNYIHICILTITITIARLSTRGCKFQFGAKHVALAKRKAIRKPKKTSRLCETALASIICNIGLLQKSKTKSANPKR